MKPTFTPVFAPSSPQAGDMLHLFVVVLIVCGAIFTVVATWVAISVVRFRSRPGAAESRQGRIS